MIPEYLKNARRVDNSLPKQERQTPSYLQNAKKIKDSIRSKETVEENVEPDFESDPDIDREIERNIARQTSRAIETVLGLPGDLASFFAGLIGKEQNIIPGSSDIKSFAEEASQGYLKPQNQFEESTDELISDIASMGLPGTGKYTFFRNLGIPIIGSLAKEGLKYANKDEQSQAYGKIGSMVALDLLTRNKGGVKAYAGNLFKQAEEALPKGLSFDASKLSKRLDLLEKELTAGGSRPTAKKALEKVTEIKSQIKNGKINARELAAFRPSINEAIEELGGFQLEVPKKLKPKAIFNLNQVKNDVIKTLDEYGEKFNPEFAKLNRSANEAWAAYQKSNKIANFIHDRVPYSPKSKAVQALFSYAPYAAAGSLATLTPAGALGVGGGLGLYQTYKVLDRVTRSPTLRKYYLQTLKSASAGNIPQASKNIRILDQKLLNEEED